MSRIRHSPAPTRRPAEAALALVLALGLAACDSLSDLFFGKTGPAPPCPTVSILKDALALTEFRPGGGRDLTDVVLDARIVDVRSTCTYTRVDKTYTNVSTTLQVVADAERGPADRQREATLRYFVAIPQFYPQPRGRSEFAMRVQFTGNRSRLRVTDPPITVNIPLAAGKTGLDYEIFVGFDLSREQVEYNRKRQQAR